MQYYTILDSKFEKEFDTKYGRLVSYDLKLLGQDGDTYLCYINQKPETPEPLKDARIFGDIAQDKLGHPKFTKMQEPEEQGGAQQTRLPNTPQTSQSAPRSYTEDPDKQLAIIRQSSLKSAVEFVTATQTAAVVEDVLKVAHRFVEFCENGYDPTSYEIAKQSDEKDQLPFDAEPKEEDAF